MILGALAASIATLVGPALQVITSPTNTVTLAWSELFGTRLGALVSVLDRSDGISRERLLRILPGLLVGVAGLKALLSSSQWFMWERLTENVAKKLRSDIIGAYLYLNPLSRQQDRDREATLSSVLSTDVRMMRIYLVHFYGGLPREGLQSAFLFLTLLLLSPQLFMIFLFGVAPVVLIVSHLGKKLRRRAGRALKDYSTLTEWLQQRLLGIETIKHYGTEKFELTKMKALNTDMFKAFYRAARVKARTAPIIEGVAIAAMAGVLYYAFASELSGAVQLSFFTTLGLFSQSAAKLGKYYNQNREGRAAISRIEGLTQYLLSHQKTQLNGPSFMEGKKDGFELLLKDLSFRFPEAHDNALEDFSYRFCSGRIYCVCGSSGAGKSTLFKLILGLLTPTKGEVIVESNSPRSLGYLPQRLNLASTTIAETVSYPDISFDTQQVLLALRQAGLENFVTGLDAGVLTEVGSGGLGLSGGQVQRLGLARLFYHNYDIVLVDEGTSALDPETEQLIHNSLKQLALGGALVIMIAHRLSAAQISDEIILLRNSQLDTAGSVTDVMNSQAFQLYSGLANSQS